MSIVAAVREKGFRKSKSSEWKGLDRISAMVHEMKCIWREQEKDDIGIDGEIELCVDRSDGEGMIGTGKIIKVQSKSGSKYVTRDTDTSFASPIEEKDVKYWIKLNVPAIYIVYHPDDDCLYWKHIQGAIKNGSASTAAPYRLELDKHADKFDQAAYGPLLALCQTAPDRVSMTRGETLFSNVLPVLSLPSNIYAAPVLPEKRSNFHDRLRGADWIPPYVFDAGTVMTLVDLERSSSVLDDMIDKSSLEKFSMVEWLNLNRANDGYLRRLLNSTLHRHLRSLGLEFAERHKRYFFNRGLSPDSTLKRNWKSLRSGREHTRIVAKYYEYGKHKFYRHLALRARVEQIGSDWGVVLDPQVYLSIDGTARWEGTVARSYAIKARVEEWNNVFLNNIFFWSFIIAKGDSSIHLQSGGQNIFSLSGVPASCETSFSYHVVPEPDRSVKAQPK